MSSHYRIKELKCQSGERLPLLLDRATGVPLWDPTLFTLTELRATNLASATLSQAARALLVGHLALAYMKVDLTERISEGRLLELGEIDTLAKLAGLRQQALEALLDDKNEPLAAPTVTSLEKVRMRRSQKSEPRVASETQGIRLMYIRDYIAWLAARKILALDIKHEHYQALVMTSQLVVSRIAARVPSKERKGDIDQRQGLPLEIRERLLQVIDQESPENPWKNKHARLRNELIILWLLHLGTRRGELLGLHTTDADLRVGEVRIMRRPDNPIETRKVAANSKTKSRLLALGPDLMELTRKYIMGPRAAIPGARRHPFLFVATGTGKPLTTSALNKVFRELRTKIPGLTCDLSPHVLRHTWNDDFSELMDKQGVSGEDEERMRRQAMGWSDNSKMAAHYTRRHVQRKSNAASMTMQTKSFNSSEEESS